MKCFEDYKIGVFDEMFEKDGSVKTHWQTLELNLQELKIKGLTQKQYEIDWQLRENGVTYNIYSDQKLKRKWNLDPIPFILNQNDWDTLKNGIKQRVKLLDAIFKDIYGEQKIIKEGILPVEILYLDSHFTREVHGFDDSYFNLTLYAADLSRGPNGKFWVISDKTDSPSGLGYAIENRLTMNSVNADIIKNIKISRIANFIEGFKQSIGKHSKNKEPFTVMLSPGPYNETYFEQSYLSSILDCELVRGEDLLVKEGYLYLQNLSGLKQIDIIIRRVDDRFCDPLELRNDSKLGVPGLLEVLREGNVTMINPIGIGILENPALNPFLNKICEYFFNEPLILPQIATWWCGQKTEMVYVLENISNLIVKSIDKTQEENIYVCEDMDPSSLKTLKEKILKNPHLYIAQERIEFSTVPAFENDKIEARKNSIRIFCYKDEDQYHIMQGGLVRISQNKDAFIVSNQNGGGSKDLWILSDEETNFSQISPLNFQDIAQKDNIGSLTTKRAENIFWLGRYLQRAIISARVIRLNLKYMLSHIHCDSSIVSETLTIFSKTLTHLTMTYPGFLSEKQIDPIKEMKSIIDDKNRVGSLSFTLSMLSNVHLNIKNQLSNESRKVFDILEAKWFNDIYGKKIHFRDYVENLDTLLIYLTSYKELLNESIFKEQGIVFYQIGNCVETSVLLISKIRSLLTFKYDKDIENEILQFLLYSYEGYNAYKSYYKTQLDIKLVIGFLMFEENYPKSLISLVKNLLKEVKSIHGEESIRTDFDGSDKTIIKLLEILNNVDIKTLLILPENEFIYEDFDNLLNDITSLLIQFSNEFTKNYFSHYYE